MGIHPASLVTRPRSKLSVTSLLLGIIRSIVRSSLVVVIPFLVLMMLRAPHLAPMDWDYDEGINLMKSALVNQGYDLYGEIWSDQPPLLTLILSASFMLFGQSVTVARLLIIGFSTVLIGAFYQIIRHTISHASAVVATLLLIISEHYLRLSGAVMVGLPSLALLLSSIAILLLGRNRVIPVIGSGILMALALQTKLMVGLAIPGVITFLFISGWRKVNGERESINIASRFIVIGLWLLVLLITFLLVGLTTQSLRIDLLLEPHFGSQTRTYTPFAGAGPVFLRNFAQQHYLYLLLGLAGLFWAGWRRAKGIVIPAIWLIVGIVALAIHRPVWYHHTLYLTIPLVWLCAFGIEVWMRSLSSSSWSIYRTPPTMKQVSLLIIGLLVVVGLYLYPQPLESRLADEVAQGRPTVSSALFAQLLADSAIMSEDERANAWLLTDRPYYAFLAKRPVLPALVVFSRKRLTTGQLTNAMLVEQMQIYRPQAILLERFAQNFSPQVMDAIEAEYRLVASEGTARYYLRKE